MVGLVGTPAANHLLLLCRNHRTEVARNFCTRFVEHDFFLKQRIVFVVIIDCGFKFLREIDDDGGGIDDVGVIDYVDVDDNDDDDYY